MPDFTLCQNLSCPLKETCNRQVTNETTTSQSFADFEFSTDGLGNAYCASYWPVVENSTSRLAETPNDFLLGMLKRLS